MPMIVVCILSLLAGCGVFIAGMNQMSGSLEKATGKGLKNLLGKIGNNRFASVGIGASITAIIQSSSATSVMVVGLVNAGVLSLFQATAIIMGANIGTTVTGLLVSLSSLNISLFTSVFAFIGVMMMFIKNDKVKNIGATLCGLGLIFVGLELMSNAFDNAEVKDFFVQLFSKIDFPLLLILVGIIFTGIVQSSSAVTGVIIIMVGQGALTMENALFLILGSNIGTCVTALMATIGTNANAKRTGLIHLLFNVIGAVLFTIFIWIFKAEVVQLLEKLFPNNAQFQIAVFHIFFNVVTTLLLLPFIRQLVALSTWLIKDKKEESEVLRLKYIDERLLKTPMIAFVQVKKEVEYMASLAQQNLDAAMQELMVSTKAGKEKILQVEKKINYMNNEITRFLIQLAPLMNDANENALGSYFHVVNDIERIGDHAENLIDIQKVLDDEHEAFSEEGKESIQSMYQLIQKMFTLSMETFDETAEAHLQELNQLEEKVDTLKEQLTNQHYLRLSSGNCKVELNSLFISIVSNLERVGDHLVNIGNSIKNPTGDDKCEN